MKFKYLLFCLLPLCGLISCNNGRTGDIEFTFNTTSKKTGTSTLSFSLTPGPSALTSPNDYRIYIDWGDGKTDTITVDTFTGDFSHSYDKANKFRIKINGDISGFTFSNDGQMLSDDNINTDEFVLNSIAKIGIGDNDIKLGGFDSTGEVVSKMSEVKINYPLSSLYSEMFEHTSLKTVTLPNSLIGIKFGDFTGLETLETINLPNDSCLTIIEDDAFKDCIALKSFTIPKYIDELGNGVFSGCTSLESFTFPSHLTALGEKSEAENLGTFEGCTKLKTLKFEGTIPPEIQPNTFINLVPEKVSVPKGCKERYIGSWKGEVSDSFLAKIVEE